jgi:hypothetical protein
VIFMTGVKVLVCHAIDVIALLGPGQCWTASG